MNQIAVASMEAEFLAGGSLHKLSCIWYPGQTLTLSERDCFTEQIVAINRNRRQPLNYGFFKPANKGHWQQQFLKKSIWCVISDERGPYGFAYKVDLGKWEGSKVIHAGLVGASKPMGLEKIHAMSFALCLGNLVNFGPYFCTNISHLPATAALFARTAQEVYPSYEQKDLSAQYLPMLRMLRDQYVSAVLELEPHSVCEKTYRLLGSLDGDEPGFETDWRVVSRHANTADRG